MATLAGSPIAMPDVQTPGVVLHCLAMHFYFEDPEHIKRERRKAQELRASSWWKQRLGEGVCYYCHERFSKELLTMDHVVPVARGGRSTKQNCVVACKACNSKKGHLLPVEQTLLKLENGE